MPFDVMESNIFKTGSGESVPTEPLSLLLYEAVVHRRNGDIVAIKVPCLHGYCQELCANTTASLMKLVRRRPNRPRACSAWLPVSGPPVVRQGWRSHLRSPWRAAGGLLPTPGHSSLLRVFPDPSVPAISCSCSVLRPTECQ